MSNFRATGAHVLDLWWRQSQSGLPYSHCGGEHSACSLRSTSGATPTNLFTASMALSCFYLNVCFSSGIGCRCHVWTDSTRQPPEQKANALPLCHSDPALHEGIAISLMFDETLSKFEKKNFDLDLCENHVNIISCLKCTFNSKLH